MSMKTTATTMIDPHHGKPSAHSSGWHTAWLLVHLVAVIAVTKMNANPLETLLTSMNAPVAFTGFPVALLIPVAGRPWRPESGAQQSGSAGDESVFRLRAGHHLADGPGGHPHRLPRPAMSCAWPWRPGDVVMVASAGAVPYLLLHRTHQCAERRGPTWRCSPPI